MQTFPEVRWNASRLMRWNDVRAVAEFGMDFFDGSVEPIAPDGNGSRRLMQWAAWNACEMLSLGGMKSFAA
jgi:hypothetical protein